MTVPTSDIPSLDELVFTQRKLIGLLQAKAITFAGTDHARDAVNALAVAIDKLHSLEFTARPT